MTAPQFEALRDQRRQMARQLSDQGFSARQVADRLGVSHTTILDDLAATAPRDGAEPTIPATGSRRFTFDQATGQLTVLLSGLDGVGLGGQLTDARRLLARADAAVIADRHGHEQAQQVRERVVVDVADGRLTLADASAALAGAAPWLTDSTSSPMSVVADRVVAELRRRAVQAARSDWLVVHDALRRLADAAVRRGVEAGGRLVDCKRVAKVLTPPPMLPKVDGVLHRHPWVDNPPVLPAVDGAALAADPSTAPAWATASQAYAELRRLVEVADLLRDAGGPASLLVAANIDRNALYIVEQMPEQVHLAVFDALGWRPGLHASLKPSPRNPASERRRTWTPPAPLRVGPFGLGSVL